MSDLDPCNPWTHSEGRGYLTPDDIQAAINAGGSREQVWGTTLAALGRRRCEDWSLCAFVAARFEPGHGQP
jgi:hypothetical protein